VNGSHELDLSDEQWAFVLPLLPPDRVRHTSCGRIWPDRVLFAIVAFLLVREQPWSAGADYGVSGATLQRRWAEWREASVFARMVRAGNGRTAVGQWAWLVARASEHRAARSGYGSVAPPLRAGPSDEDRQWAWCLQNAFPEGS
jgi:transposase